MGRPQQGSEVLGKSLSSLSGRCVTQPCILCKTQTPSRAPLAAQDLFWGDGGVGVAWPAAGFCEATRVPEHPIPR